MRMLLTALILLASPVSAQSLRPVVQPPASLIWNPSADYITAGQDEPGYRSWYLAAPWRASQIRSFNDYLAAYRVAGIVPTWQLLRTATSWHKCGGQPFEVPPASEWPHIVQTLRYINDYVIPTVGPVEPVSGYRNPVLNVCAGGAPESAHKQYSAIDMVPLRPITREQLMQALCSVHARRGPSYAVGLGFYAFLRFHVDTTKFRRWGTGADAAASCPPIIRPEDVASVSMPVGTPSQGSAPAAGTPPLASGAAEPLTIRQHR